MKVFEVVDRNEVSRIKDQDRTCCHEQGSARKPNVRARWLAQEFKWMDGPGFAAAAGRNKDHIVEVFDVTRANSYAELFLKAFVELLDCCDLETRTRCCGRLRRCLYGTRQAARSWQREIEKRSKAAGIVLGRMSKWSFKSPYRKSVGVARRRHFARRTEITCWMQYGSLHESAMRHENKRWERDQLMRVNDM